MIDIEDELQRVNDITIEVVQEMPEVINVTIQEDSDEIVDDIQESEMPKVEFEDFEKEPKYSMY